MQPKKPSFRLWGILRKAPAFAVLVFWLLWNEILLQGCFPAEVSFGSIGLLLLCCLANLCLIGFLMALIPLPRVQKAVSGLIGFSAAALFSATAFFHRHCGFFPTPHQLLALWRENRAIFAWKPADAVLTAAFLLPGVWLMVSRGDIRKPAKWTPVFLAALFGVLSVGASAAAVRFRDTRDLFSGNYSFDRAVHHFGLVGGLQTGLADSVFPKSRRDTVSFPVSEIPIGNSSDPMIPWEELRPANRETTTR